MNNSLTAPLPSKARAAVAAAKTYIESRQSSNGGFCFYKSEHVDEPNLHDTYHAVAALTLLSADVPRADDLAQFLVGYRLSGPTYYYYYALALDLLGRVSLIDPNRLAAIRDLTITVPSARRRVVTTGWLESTLQILRLKRRFAQLQGLPQVLEFINSLKAGGGYGDKANLCDTRLCLAILALLGDGPPTNDTRGFVDQLQRPSFGFALTTDSLVANLDVAYAGMKCCSMLGIPVRYTADVLKFVLACQTSKGGFSRAPSALPDIELTHRALQIIGLLDQNLLSSAI